MPETTDFSGIAAVVEDIARRAGTIALGHFNGLADLPVEQKGHLDLVTVADREVETFLIGALQTEFPDDGIYGEEGANIPGTSGRVWILDPIDGTFNFVRGGQGWAISIGLFQNRRPVFGVIHAPAREVMLSGGKGYGPFVNGKSLAPLPVLDLTQASMGIGLHPTVATADRLEVVRFISDELKISFRCCGSATQSFMQVAMGETDGYVSLGDATWDVMAALPILENLGVTHTIDWDTVHLDDKLRFACGSESFIEKVRPLLVRVAKAA